MAWTRKTKWLVVASGALVGALAIALSLMALLPQARSWVVGWAIAPSENGPVPPPPVRQGNKAELLINGEASFLERMRLLDQAKSSIYIQALIFKADTVGYEIADRLIAKKRKNPQLDIRLIVDALSNVQDVNSQLLYFELRNAGIKVQGYEAFYLHWMSEVNLKDWKAGNKRYHEKYWIIDGVKAIVGGMNVGDEYARTDQEPAMTWRDQDVFLEGQVVGDIQEAFLSNDAAFDSLKKRWPSPMNTDGYWAAWHGIHPKLRSLVAASMGKTQGWKRASHGAWNPAQLEERRIRSPLHDNVSVQFIQNRPRLGETWIAQAYLKEIKGAKQSVTLANAYFIPTAAMKQALVDASRRGVLVTVLTNSKETNDIPIITDVARLSYLELIQAGVQIHEWHGERKGEGTLHAKFAVFDSKVIIMGSYNLDPRSQGLNSEDVVLIENPLMAGELEKQVKTGDLAKADRITEEQARLWSDPSLVPLADEVPLPWFDPRFDPDRFELFLLRQAEKNL
jgi:putative cardiolipin synthase